MFKAVEMFIKVPSNLVQKVTSIFTACLEILVDIKIVDGTKDVKFIALNHFFHSIN